MGYFIGVIGHKQRRVSSHELRDGGALVAGYKHAQRAVCSLLVDLEVMENILVICDVAAVENSIKCVGSIEAGRPGGCIRKAQVVVSRVSF